MILELFRKHNEFYKIQGYDDITDIVGRALDAEDKLTSSRSIIRQNVGSLQDIDDNSR